MGDTEFLLTGGWQREEVSGYSLKILSRMGEGDLSMQRWKPQHMKYCNTWAQDEVSFPFPFMFMFYDA